MNVIKESEAELNAEILKITMTTASLSELSGHLEEMPVTIPSKYKAGVSRKKFIGLLRIPWKAMVSGLYWQQSRTQSEHLEGLSPVNYDTPIRNSVTILLIALLISASTVQSSAQTVSCAPRVLHTFSFSDIRRCIRQH